MPAIEEGALDKEGVNECGWNGGPSAQSETILWAQTFFVGRKKFGGL
jgi:hypothetical protein